MERMKSYNLPHKGLRNALSQLQQLAGSTDYRSPKEVTNLYKLGKDVFEILTVHAEDENEITLAELEQRCPGCSQHDMEDHERIHLQQLALEQLSEEIYAKSQSGSSADHAASDGEEFYLRLSEFHGVYLLHTAEEERITQPLLWKYFSDEELATHRSQIISRMPAGTLEIWLRFILPALTEKERMSFAAR